MLASNILTVPERFSELLYEKMKRVNPGIENLALYEFRYALDNLCPADGWTAVRPDSCAALEAQISQREFFAGIQLKPQVNGQIVLDPAIARLTNMLFVGLVQGEYPEGWVNARFYFDVRGFNFLVRTVYRSERMVAHLGGRPFRAFEPKQRCLEGCEVIGYPEFEAANAEVDGAFIGSVEQLIAARGTPILIAIAGPTAAGKTEIVARLRRRFELTGRRMAAVELDHFYTDRDDREARGINSLGTAAIHLGLLRQCLDALVRGEKIVTPRYDFINGTSSHDLDGHLKPGRAPLEIEPADIIFVEGNFPFLIEEVAHLIGIKVVYLTDDPIRLKRKWKRDIDLRKKYDPNYLRNRFFKDQFLMAQACYLPQLERCDVYVDTTGAALWVTPEIARILDSDLRFEIAR